MHPNMFFLLVVNSWALVGCVFVLGYYGAYNSAYNYGKLVLIFLAGITIGMAVA